MDHPLFYGSNWSRSVIIMIVQDENNAKTIETMSWLYIWRLARSVMIKIFSIPSRKDWNIKLNGAAFTINQRPRYIAHIPWLDRKSSMFRCLFKGLKCMGLYRTGWEILKLLIDTSQSVSIMFHRKEVIKFILKLLWIFTTFIFRRSRIRCAHPIPKVL